MLLLLLLLPPPVACSDWVDIDTPASAHLHPSYFDGAPLLLTFSDEFAREGRSFVDGNDARWTSLQLPPSTNFQVNWYNESLAFTRDGKLELSTIHKEVTFPAGNGSFETRYMQSAMLQTWNKFCFSEGLIELRAKLPGKPEQAGLWPAFWLMGNLGRATYTSSTDGLWPWIFDECVPLDSPDCEANQCYSQRISACDPDPGFGMNPYQGRGSPEIDIIEVVPGSGDVVYPPKPECKNSPYRDEATANALALKKPFVSTTLQAAPGFPTGSDQRPPDACVPERGNTSAELQWYYGLDIFSVHNASTHDVVFNIEFFGGSFPDYMGGDGLQIDVVSANTALGSTYWDDYHVYSCEWRPGKQGYIVWLLDGIVQYTLEASVLGTPRPITKDGIGIGTRRGLSVPSEPMYVILNVDISPVWGWKSHSPTTNCDAPCECCYDCKRLECTRCMKTDASGKPYNVRAWFADFCDTLPASFLIDWVRVHQPPTSTSVGCSTPSHPTKLWIAAHEESYRNPDQEVPMLAVVPGGGGCDDDARCNSPHGSCVNGACVCSSRQWTGPFCLSQAAGDALACHDFETQARYAYPVVNKSRSQQCAVSPKYNITWLQHLRAAACERAEAEGWSLALQACTDSNATSPDAAYAACSEFARTSHVVRALYSDSEGTECCNTFIIDLQGDLRLQCLRGTTPGWLLLGVPVVFLLAIVVTMTFKKARQQAADVQQHEDPLDLDANGPTIEIADDSPVSQRKLADRCLLWCSEDARNVRRQLADRLRERFGFQASSCAVQLEHLEALVVSHLGTSDGNFGEAVKNLHESILEHFEHWHLHVSERPVALKSSSAAYAKAKMNRSQKQHVSWFLADRNMAHKVWQRQTEDDQLEEILLYLLIWGEAGNLRFMPELLCFLFEIARGHLSAPTTCAVHEGWYLEKIVKPLYSCIFKETYQGMKNGKPQLLGPERMPK
ncbi:hypothetical protein AB1Y20_005495 [Prymnesium parvum]|uniref:GH16 domain-containing protein n=1 Tax=Prymnesium parvum TaxID=97485 RepID=A0AB34J3I7_PRYPA